MRYVYNRHVDTSKLSIRYIESSIFRNMELSIRYRTLHSTECHISIYRNFRYDISKVQYSETWNFRYDIGPFILQSAIFRYIETFDTIYRKFNTPKHGTFDTILDTSFYRVPYFDISKLSIRYIESSIFRNMELSIRYRTLHSTECHISIRRNIRYDIGHYSVPGTRIFSECSIGGTRKCPGMLV